MPAALATIHAWCPSLPRSQTLCTSLISTSSCKQLYTSKKLVRSVAHTNLVDHPMPSARFRADAHHLHVQPEEFSDTLMWRLCSTPFASRIELGLIASAGYWSLAAHCARLTAFRYAACSPGLDNACSSGCVFSFAPGVGAVLAPSQPTSLINRTACLGSP